MHNREKIIRNYIEGYNNFDMDKMVTDMSKDIIFENIQNGEINLSLSGLSAFIEQAKMSRDFFTSRKQIIKSFKHQKNKTEIIVEFQAVPTIDLPNGYKKGKAFQLTGTSEFEFTDDKITRLTDIS